MADAITIEGLDEIRRNLRTLDSKLPTKVSQGFRKTFNSVVLPEARRALSGLGHVPNRPSAIAVFASQKEAGLVLRGSRYPWILGAEWGSHQYRQFLPWVGNQYTGAGQFPGYAAGAALRATIGQVDRDVLDVIAKLMLEGR